MGIEVVKAAPESTLAFPWHPYAVDPKADCSYDPTTLVAFALEATETRTLLTIVGVGLRWRPATSPRRSVPEERQRLGRTDGQY